MSELIFKNEKAIKYEEDYQEKRKFEPFNEI